MVLWLAGSSTTNHYLTHKTLHLLQRHRLTPQQRYCNVCMLVASPLTHTINCW